MISRINWEKRVIEAFAQHPVVAILGPRQCGKTTLAREIFSNSSSSARLETNYFDLEDPVHINRLQNPKLALESLQGLIVIDEIQLVPELFPVLRVLVDRPSNQGRFLILGSASRDLIRQSSETLAGRIQYLELTPFSLQEISINKQQLLFIRLCFPKSFLASDDQLSSKWREEFIRTYLERDLPQLGITIPSQTLRRFWITLAHYHGKIFNASELGRSFGVSDTTVKRYLDILSGTFMVRQLSPWIENIKKRQIKSPKIYFRDSGIFHQLLGISKYEQLLVHPQLGSSWEGFAMEEVLRAHYIREEDAYFWGIHEQCELDLLLLKEGKRVGFEFKYQDAPKFTLPLRKTFEYLKLDRLIVIYPGKTSYPMEDNIYISSLEEAVQGIKADPPSSR